MANRCAFCVGNLPCAAAGAAGHLVTASTLACARLPCLRRLVVSASAVPERRLGETRAVIDPRRLLSVGVPLGPVRPARPGTDGQPASWVRRCAPAIASAATARTTAIPTPTVQGLRRWPPTPASAHPARTSGSRQQSTTKRAPPSAISSPPPGRSSGRRICLAFSWLGRDQQHGWTPRPPVALSRPSRKAAASAEPSLWAFATVTTWPSGCSASHSSASSGEAK